MGALGRDKGPAEAGPAESLRQDRSLKEALFPLKSAGIRIHNSQQCSGGGFVPPAVGWWLCRQSCFRYAWGMSASSERIVCAGEALIDLIPEQDSSVEQRFRPRVGGAPLNTAVAARRMGFGVSFLSRLSTDFFGQMIHRFIADNGLDEGLLVRTTDPTTLAFASLREDRGADYQFYVTQTADTGLSIADLPQELPADTRALAFGSIALLAEPEGTAIEALVTQRTSRVLRSFDPNVRPRLIRSPGVYRERFWRLAAHSAVLKLSDEDLEWLQGEDSREVFVRRCFEVGVQIVAVTEGAKGGRLFAPGIEVWAPSPNITVADTVGAGDTFHAALLAGLLDTGMADGGRVLEVSAADLEQILAFAIGAASNTCTRTGADPPWRSEIQPSLPRKRKA